MNKQRKRGMLTTEEMTRLRTLTINALVELLNKHGVLREKDVLERIKMLQARAQASTFLERVQGRDGLLKRIKEN
jgi:hypothetical protein